MERPDHSQFALSPSRKSVASEQVERRACDVSDLREELARTRAALKESQEHYRWSVELNPQVPWTATPEGEVTEIAPQWSSLTGFDIDRAGAGGWAEALHPDDRVAAQNAWSEAITTGKPYDVPYRLRLRSGEYQWFRARGLPRLDQHGEIVFWYGTIEHIHDQRQADASLRESEDLYRSTIELSSLIPWSTDPAGQIVHCDARWLVLTGIATDQGFDALARMALHPEDYEVSIMAWAGSRRTGQQYDVENRVRLRNGNYRWFRARAAPRLDENGQVLQWYGTMEDIHDRKTVEDRVRWAATHDMLTGLPNRLLFQQFLTDNVELARESGEMLALLVADIDHLKQTNDILGHFCGDTLLNEFVARARSVIGPGALLARLAGDEFGIVLPKVKGSAEVADVAEKIMTALKHPFRIEGYSQDCRASIGMALFPQHGRDENELMKNADIALYDAKRGGRAQARVFDNEMASSLQRRMSMLSVARTALEHDRIEPFYQPKVELSSNRIMGFEALLRWHHPSRGIQLPETIAAAFEDPEIALDISDRMFDRVIRDMKHWKHEGFSFGRIAVNLSAAEFRREKFAEGILDRLDRAGLSTSQLEVEVTEKVFLGGRSGHVERALGILSDAGVTIALDDFGTGYASLTHLKQFPVDVLKVDQSFVRHLSHDRDDAAIVQAIVGLGISLGLAVVAEGIETDEQATLLMKCGCKLGQGFLFGKGIPACDVPARLAA
jgi:diguanylate cyclase (GGDEF)-like protein/PAS domain S-box-containing protein